jgi:hypothetical protein
VTLLFNKPEVVQSANGSDIVLSTRSWRFNFVSYRDDCGTFAPPVRATLSRARDDKHARLYCRSAPHLLSTNRGVKVLLHYATCG